ncbi:hypothetical protein OJ998_31670 [Solirubrobacter taibaiensis]|nr:hypothetical protein [Solirubrobacter taibaiensis]
MTLIYAGLTDGAWNLFWMYLWLVSTIAASYLSERKGYGDRPGLATGLILSIVGTIIWLVIPPKPESKWKQLGPFGAQKRVPSKASS